MRGRKPIPVDIYDLSGRYICTAPSITEAAIRCRCTFTNVYRALKGGQTRARYYIVQYHKENTDAD